MRAQLKFIETNDYRSWAEFEAAEVADTFDHFGWFTVEIGDDESAGSEMFQVVVSTPLAIQRAKRSASGLPNVSSKFRGVVVPEFEPSRVREDLDEFVSGVSGLRWEEIRDELMKSMYWEYE